MEQSVIGALLVDNDAIDRLGELRPEHFYRYDHRIIFEYISRLLVAGRPADALTVFEMAATMGKAEEIGGLAYVNTMAQSVPGSANIARYAQIVVDRWKLRTVVAIADEISASAFAPKGRTVDQIIDAAQQRFMKLGESRSNEPKLASSDLTQIVEEMDAQFHGSGSTATSTGFTDLDAKLDGGMNGGELVIVAGRPSMGKTAFAMCVAGHVVDKEGPVLVFSMEMPSKQLSQRNIARVGGIPLSHVKDGSKFLDEEWPRLTHAVQVLADQQLFIDDDSGMTLMEIVNRSRAIKRRHGLKLIVVDYLGLMTGGPDERNDLRIASYSSGLKGLAKQLGVPVVALAQLNRSVEQRPNKRPTMADLRDSGAIEQDADTILFLYRDEVYHPDTADRGTAEVIIAKQRNGEIGHVRLAFIGEHSKFADLAPGYASAPRVPAGRVSKGFDE
jgi:replicative DNA helicase